MSLSVEARRRGRQARIDEMETYPEFKILETLVNDPKASPSDAVRQLLDLTTTAASTHEYRDLGVHPWHTSLSLIEIAKRNPPSRHTKLVECIAKLQKTRVTNPRTDEPLKINSGLVWTQLPSLGYTASDEWNSYLPNHPLTTPEDQQRWERFIALLAQLSAAADVDYDDPMVHPMDFSMWSLRAFKEASEPADGQQVPTDHVVRTACMWALYAAERLWANVRHGRVFDKRDDKPGTEITREMWDSWYGALVAAQTTGTDEETERLVDDAVTKMRKVSAGTS